MIDPIEGRFTERFVEPANSVLSRDDADSAVTPEGRGFAILALDCLLIEALYGYAEGHRTKSSGATSEAFEKFLSSKPWFKKDFEVKKRSASYS